MNEQMLKEKLQKLEALFAMPGTEGERLAAEQAIKRIRERLEEVKVQETGHWKQDIPPILWVQSEQEFLTLLERKGRRPE